MTLVRCEKDGRPGWVWGEDNLSCFSYVPGDEVGEDQARSAALRQAMAIVSREEAQDEVL